jgi:hypothetical protein
MNIALKEWSAVVTALDRGAQIFLLRKGGIVEAKRGFEPRYAEFLFFPTTEHQHARYLKPQWVGLVPNAEVTDSLHVSHVGRVADVLRAPQPCFSKHRTSGRKISSGSATATVPTWLCMCSWCASSGLGRRT